MSSQDSINLDDAYNVELAEKGFKAKVPRRRSGDYSHPLTLNRKLRIENEFTIGDTLLSEFGLEDFVGGSNAEHASRPVPQVFRASDTDALTNLVAPALPELFEWILPQVHPPWQSYNEVSRMGAPFYTPYDDKKFILNQLLSSYLASDFSILEGHVIQIGVRIQSEPLGKKREFTFIDANGQLRVEALDRSKEKVKVWGFPRYVGRTRLVFNQGIFNLLNQVVDTALNDVYGKHPAFHHDVSRAGPMVTGPVLAFDVSHMERLTARIVHERAKIIGGPYGAFQEYLRHMPFLVPADDWSRAFKLTCNYDKGYMVQFGSGNSAVSPSQKDIFMCLYRQAANELLNVPLEQGFDWVAQSGDERLRVFNFGDDNFVFSPSGDETLINELYSFMGQYLTVSIEDPPKFLGYEYVDSNFRLPISSYILKTYQNERGPVPPFRRFPYWGIVQKRAHYEEFGDPRIAQEVIPRENELFKKFGTSYSAILEGAADDKLALHRLTAAQIDYFSNPDYLLGKQDYLIGHREKVKVGGLAGYTGLTPKETAFILKNAVSKPFSERIDYAI
jgi:hypothetical protein